MMGSRIISESPTDLPDVITIDDEDDKENIANGSEYEVDAESYQWKSELKPITAGTNVISKKQAYKSNSSVLHAALDAISKKRKSLKRINVKPVKELTEEEVINELNELEARRTELKEALKAFKKNKNEVKDERKQSVISPALEPLLCDTSSSTDSSQNVRELATPRRRMSSANERPQTRSDAKKSLPLQRQMSSTAKSPYNGKKISLSPRRRMSMKSPHKPMGQENKQVVLSQMDDDGQLVLQLYPNTATDVPNNPVVAASAEQKAIKEIVAKANTLPFCKDYDPTKTVPSRCVSFIVKEMREGFKHLYYQPDLPDNDVKVPFMKEFESNNFYLFDIPDDKKQSLKTQIEKLGGFVTNSLYTATKLIFFPTSKVMVQKSLFFFLTAAVGGRYLLPSTYVCESSDAGKFLDVNDFCSFEYYDNKFDLDSSALSAIKISNFYRNLYAQNKYPKFYRYNVLFAVPRRQEEDVKLFLQILGAYVQPLYDNKKFLKNPLYTLCVTDGKILLSKESNLIPRTTPTILRDMLWKTHEKFLKT